MVRILKSLESKRTNRLGKRPTKTPFGAVFWLPAELCPGIMKAFQQLRESYAGCATVLAIVLWFPTSGVCANEAVSLAGQWRFALDRGDVGTNEKWFAKK